ncbi:hypothetical protein A3C37_03575 [Candidatus Peribacteria bacterium RIFCSPHIGHO2_02_FULL_53_20]|nr:MAG: hypothetical protein A3C37_03575 [Candidatus Peribacteria bacterium RIFCSPHIGHO2_02_FULL_53_20]OGJ68134.1 MAG: hypothetical protein A3B61_04890 [Candidatus Peribacteria bacterium RIFCSPLOWO2_01_FULL_53_10]OGJ71866.1 MAG: hypothetical protein A3G69_04690 [Candidatus Peribacteria bacterium RIFCSPLOWO2_12_FULL_53_10]
MPPFAFLAGIVLAFCYGESVFAFTVSDAINAVGPTLPTGGSFGEIIRTVAESFIPFAAVAAALAMTMSGFFMTITGNENQTTTARRVFISSLAALALINIIPTFSSLLISPTFPSGGSTILSASTTVGGAMAAEALGLVAFLEIPLGILCVIMIIVSGVRAIANFGSEDGVTQLRRTVLFVVAGFILVYTRSLLGLGIVAGTPASIISVILATLNRVIGLTIVIAVGMLVYAGILMIANIGKEEQYSKAKSLLLRVGIGLIIMVASAGIVMLLASIVI